MMTSVSEVDWKNRALAHEVLAQRSRIGQIAVMCKRDAAAHEIGEHRLDVAHNRTARRRIAHMAERERAFELLRGIAVLAEDVADQTGVALRNELRAVIGDDARCFLPTMLKRVQTEHGQRAASV